METFLPQLLKLLTDPPGNIVYHLTLAFTVVMGLQGALVNRRVHPHEHAARMAWGFALVLATQLVLFIVSGLGWQGLINPHVLLPPIERAVTAFSLIWILWMWTFQKPSRLADALAVVLSVVVVIAAIFTLVSWQLSDPSLAFNRSSLDQSWGIATIAVAVIGLLLLFVRRPETWGIGVGFVLLIITGSVAHLLGISPQGDLPGAVRLGQLCAYPLLPIMLQRFSSTSSQPAQKSETIQPVQDPQRYSADQRAVNAWALLAAQDDPTQVGMALTRAVAQTMLSDLCYLVTPPSPMGEVILQTGYDLIREDVLPGAVLQQTQMPALANAVQRGRSLRLSTTENNTSELRILAEVIGLPRTGNLLFIPLVTGPKVWGGLLLLTPYSDRIWTLEDQNYFSTTSETLVQVLQLALQRSKQPGEEPVNQQEFQNLLLHLQALQTENDHLLTEHESDQQRVPSHQDLEVLLALQNKSQVNIAAMQAENDQLRAAVRTRDPNLMLRPARETEHMEGEMRLALETVARLQNALAEANMKIMEVEQKASQSPQMASTEEREVIASIAQELRQPMASIMGYTDLLLSESVGILGALQSKFLERIKSSSERLRSLLDDLIQITALENGKVELALTPVDLGVVVDQAIADTTAQLRERSITLRVDLPNTMPRVHADQEALQQIFIHLLQNAGTVSPIEGTISLRISSRMEEKVPYLLIQVTDQGGGIAPQEIVNVFSRRFRAEHALIQGVGDTGVGLAITKSLVEAHGGRIWVDSEPGLSSTFSVLMPMRAEEKHSGNGNEIGA